MAALGLCCCVQAFSSCGEQGLLLFVSVYELLIRWLLLLQITGSRHVDSEAVAPLLTCSVPCGIFLDQGLNPCPLHWQADSSTVPPRKSNKLLFLNTKYQRERGSTSFQRGRGRLHIKDQEWSFQTDGWVAKRQPFHVSF